MHKFFPRNFSPRHQGIQGYGLHNSAGEHFGAPGCFRSMEKDEILIEGHPFEAFVPAGAKVLIMGTFPPPRKRWAMDFYYPNRTNDFWPMMGLIFFDDREALIDRENRTFRLERIKQLLEREGVAMSDTGYRVRRLKNNASDKFLEIVEPVDLAALLAKMPHLQAIATTGEKAAQVIAELTGTEVPKMGEYVIGPNGLKIWRMPSTSRAYPLPLADKAAYYRRLFS